MQTSESGLRLLVAVLAACDAPEWIAGNGFSIRLRVRSDGVDFETLRRLETAEVYAHEVSGPDGASLLAKLSAAASGHVPVGGILRLGLPRRMKHAVVASSLSDLLSVDSATWQVPASYCLLSEEFSGKPFWYDGADGLRAAPTSVQRYHDAIGLWAIIEAHADHVVDGTHNLLYLVVRRTEIAPRFVLSDLAAPIALPEISAFLAHSEQPRTRRDIFRSVLCGFVQDHKPEQAFGYLLRASDSFAGRLKEALAIYLADHSPQRLAGEAKARHLELAEKLEKVIGGLEAKSLTIPAAVLLAIKEVQFGMGWTTLNSIILASTLLYLAAMTVAHLAQRSLLATLGHTISEAEADLNRKGLDNASPVLSVSFVNLGKRRVNSAWGSLAMFAFSWVPLLSVLYAMFLAAPRQEPKSKDAFLPPPAVAPAAPTQSSSSKPAT